jgi:dihydroxyacid dehydratase/phosphogluconate dehydratase
VTPEAFTGGGIGQLADGDLLWLRIKEKRLDLADQGAMEQGHLVAAAALPPRRQLVAERQERMRDRLRQIAASNLMTDVAGAEHGCVPSAVDQRALVQLS